MTTISIRIADARIRLHHRAAQALPSATMWTRVLMWLRSAWCMINGGHYKVLHTEPNKLALRCVACGHMSPGWQVGSARMTTQRTAQDADRLRVRRAIAA